MKAVFVHGFGCWAADWDQTVNSLSGELDCIAVDLAGHGARAAESGPYTLHGAAREIADRLKDERAILVGHSMGTRIVTEIAGAAPEVAGALVLVDGSCVPGEPDPDPVLDLDEAALFGLSPEQRQGVVERVKRLPPDAARGYLNDMARWDREEAEFHIRAVRCPVRLVQSTNYTRPPDCRRLPISEQSDSLWFDFWSQTEHCVIDRVENAGHYLPIERPEAVTAAVRSTLTAIAS